MSSGATEAASATVATRRSGSVVRAASQIEGGRTDQLDEGALGQHHEMDHRSAGALGPDVGHAWRGLQAGCHQLDLRARRSAVAPTSSAARHSRRRYSLEISARLGV